LHYLCRKAYQVSHRKKHVYANLLLTTITV
jgi:hypothetical protein